MITKDKPTEQLLDLYYDLWLAGHGHEEIRRRLNVRKATYDRYVPYFLAHCRRRVTRETRARLAAGLDVNLVPLTETRADEFLSYITGGLSHAEAAAVMDVPLVTVTESWLQDPVFRARVDHAVRLANAQVVTALHRRATGYSYDASYATEASSEGTDKEGRPHSTVSKTSYVKTVHVVPSVEAAKTWLFNRVPEDWQPHGLPQGGGKKGLILEALERMTALTPEEERKLAEDDLAT
jgi:hypothetical protein